MIIWSGLGFLVALLGVGGFLCGTLAAAILGFGSLSGALGMAVAAASNWGVWKLIYPKHPQILIDAATGRQFVKNPSHSLFFIPARIWTWIFAALIIPAGVVGVLGQQAEKAQAATPGYKEFKAADAALATRGYHGASESATGSAEGFGTRLQSLATLAFTGGSKVSAADQFTTYCYEGPQNIVFLCKVPKFSQYGSDESLQGLADLAWGAAVAEAEVLDPEGKKTLNVGLRGFSGYGVILGGPRNQPMPARLGESATVSLIKTFGPPATPVLTTEK